MLTVSAIIPSKDRATFLRDAVASLLGQTQPPLEIIIVDDGDGIDPSIAAMSGTIRVLNNHRRGPVPARILGVQAAHGAAILFLDDDDWLTDTGYVAAAATALAAGCDFCFCDGEMRFDSGAAPRGFAQDATTASLERDNTILVSGVCYARAWHDRIGGFDVALPYYWDWDWYLRLARAGARLCRHAGPSVAIRVHDQNMSGDSHEAGRRANLDRFAAKHGLGPLALKNHLNFTDQA